MKSDAIDPDAGTAAGDVSPTTVFAALTSERRQHALRYLATKPGAVALGDVAEYIVIEEGTLTRDRYERVLTGLTHIHLPHLIDGGLVGYDADRETVTLLVEAESIRPYLELALSTPTE